MSGENDQGTGQEPAAPAGGQEPQSAAGQEPQGAAGGQQPPTSPPSFDAEQALKDANREAAANRVAAKEANERAEAAEKAAREAREQAEAANTRVEQTQTKHRTAVMDNAIMAEAARMGFHDPADAVRLLDREGIKVAEDGKTEGVADAVAGLAKAKPHLRQNRGASDAGAGGSGSTAGADVNSLIRRKAGRG